MHKDMLNYYKITKLKLNCLIKINNIWLKRIYNTLKNIKIFKIEYLNIINSKLFQCDFLEKQFNDVKSQN